MNILVKDDSGEYELLDDLFQCSHVNVEVIQPCCNGIDCDCGGLRAVRCPDCNNQDLTKQDIDRILE